uniref:Discoidin domain-containing protein n=1 Tax=Anopheles epiroticus TaxID=199890 RepID=A0A182PVK2_9DIPT
MVFEFDSVRNFSSMVLHTNNMFSKDVQVRYDWVGWRNDSLGWAGKPVEMVFEFDSVRNFSSMVLHTNNMFSKDV